MPHKLAVAFIHGIGRTEPGYSRWMREALASGFAKRIAVSASSATGTAPASSTTAELLFEEVNWSDVLEIQEDRLWGRLDSAESLHFERLRRFMVFFAADAIAYQPTPSDRSAYDAIHHVLALSLARLAERAGPRAPLCIVSHSLGTVIASNFIYDLSKRRGSFMARHVRAAINGTPLERGETLSLLCTMGSPIALWSLRYPRFGEPIRIPPRNLGSHHPGLEARWINFFDPDDVIAYPLRPLNAKYARAVTEDCSVDVGSILTRWNPLSHMGYWESRAVAETIASELARIWRASSAVAVVPGRRPRKPLQLPAREAID
jgi:hypothetical protein